MSTLNLNPSSPYSILRIGEAWRNRPGLVTLLITFVSVALLWGIGALSGSPAIIVLLGLVATLLWLLGFTAAGMQFMEQASGRPVSGVAAAFMSSPMIVLRSIGLAIILFLGFLAFLVVAAILLYLCKIPALGAVLYVVVLPVLTFVAALVFLGLNVIGALSAPALWEGHSLKTSLSQLWAVATQRPMEAFLNLMLLFLISGLIVGVVGGFVLAGFAITAGLSASILGGEMVSGMNGIYGSFMGGGRGSGQSSGLATAGLLGGGVVFAITGALFAAMFLLGLALTYLKVTAGVDVTAAEAAMDTAIAKTKEKAQQATEEAKRRTQEVQAAAQHRLEQARAAQAARQTAVPACPACQASITPDDVFCGNCGHKLK